MEVDLYVIAEFYVRSSVWLRLPPRPHIATEQATILTFSRKHSVILDASEVTARHTRLNSGIAELVAHLVVNKRAVRSGPIRISFLWLGLCWSLRLILYRCARLCG